MESFDFCERSKIMPFSIVAFLWHRQHKLADLDWSIVSLLGGTSALTPSQLLPSCLQQLLLLQESLLLCPLFFSSVKNEGISGTGYCSGFLFPARLHVGKKRCPEDVI